MSDIEIEIRRIVGDLTPAQLEEVYADDGMVGEAAREALEAYGYRVTEITHDQFVEYGMDCEGVQMHGWALAYPEGDPRNNKESDDE